MPTTDQVMAVLVMAAGVANAGAIGLQGVEILKTKDSTGVSVPALTMFVAIQSVFALNGYRLGDIFQTVVMIGSMFVTSWVIWLALRHKRTD